MAGWIKIHRTLEGHWIYEDNEYLGAWAKLLMFVNHTPNPWLCKKSGKLVPVARGQKATCWRSLCKLFGWGMFKTRRFMECLETDQMITLKAERHYSILTICKYNEYQDKEAEDGTQTNTHTERRQNADQQRSKKGKNDKNEKNDKKTIYDLHTSIAPEIYKEILNDPSLAAGNRDYLLECCKTMQDWSISKKERRNDWAATLRNWIRKDKKSNQQYKPKTKGMTSEEILAGMNYKPEDFIIEGNR